MKKMTSAYANKVLKKLKEDKEFWLSKEREGCVQDSQIATMQIALDKFNQTFEFEVDI